MFFDKLGFLTLAIFNTVLELFPLADSTIVDSITSQLSAFRGYADDAQWIIPVSLLFSFLSAVLVIEGSLLTFKVARWIANNITLGFIK